MNKKIISFVVLTMAFFNVLNAQTVFTFRSPESELDHRFDYDNALLKLALDNTVLDYGSYELKPSPVMNFSRMMSEIKNGSFENPMMMYSATNENIVDTGQVPFPMDLGIVGFRVFFVSPEAKSRLEKVESIDDLKEFVSIQGSGWTDIRILRTNGFDVKEVPGYESLFKMIVNSRADILPRGVNEVKSEISNHLYLEDLQLDNHLLLYYPLPRFYFTNKGNTKGIERVKVGLERAYNNGSLMELWKKYFQESIDFVKMEKRLLLKLENPFVSDIDKSYEKYLFKFN